MNKRKNERTTPVAVTLMVVNLDLFLGFAGSILVFASRCIYLLTSL